MKITKQNLRKNAPKARQDEPSCKNSQIMYLSDVCELPQSKIYLKLNVKNNVQV